MPPVGERPPSWPLLVAQDQTLRIALTSADRRTLPQAPSSRYANAVRTGNLRQRRPLGQALQRLLALVRIEARLAPKLDTFGHRRLRPSSVRSRIRSRSNSAMAARNVDSSLPCDVVVSNNGSPKLLNEAPTSPRLMNQIQELSRRAAKAVDLRHHDDVARPQRFHQLRQLRAIGADAADLLREDAIGTGRLLDLRNPDPASIRGRTQERPCFPPEFRNRLSEKISH